MNDGMKFPICEVCLKNDILCNSCSSKIKKEQIKKEEVDVYRRIYSLVKLEPHLKDAEIKRILLDSRFALVVVKRDDISKIIGKNGIIVKKLAKNINRQIRVVSDSFDVNEFAKEVLFPSSILGINTIYSQEEEIYKVRLPISERVLLQITPEIFSEIARTILKKRVELIFE